MKSKRAFWRLLAAGVVLSFGVAVQSEPANAGPEEQWLRAHNKYRCIHGVPAMTWSKQLAAMAQNTANQCHCQHCNIQTKGKYFENMTCYNASPQAVVDDWYSEKPRYNYQKPAYVGGSGPTTNGHFINVVAKALVTVGCGCDANDCVCVYGGYFNYQDSAALRDNVLVPVRTDAQCQASSIDYCATCKGGQGEWQKQSNNCWKIDGYAPGTTGNPATECNVCWQNGAITACGSRPPPLSGFWRDIGGQKGSRFHVIGGYPPGWTPEGCWHLLGGAEDHFRCPMSPVAPDLKGIRVGGQPACWTQLTSTGISNGRISCEY